MNKIINGKRYAPTGKTLRATHENGLPGDINYSKEELHRKQTGEYFIYGEGGARSRYAKRINDNNWSGGVKIIPISENAAQEWVENYCTADEYDTIFGAVDDSAVTQISFRVTVAEAEKLKAAALRRNISQADLIHEYLADISVPESFRAAAGRCHE